MSEVEKLRKQIAETLPCFRDIFDKMPCPYDGKCNECGDVREVVDHLIVIIRETGYHLVEPVQLEVLGDEVIDNLAKVSRYYVGKSEERAFTECVKDILQAAIVHNEAKFGRLYKEK